MLIWGFACAVTSFRQCLQVFGSSAAVDTVSLITLAGWLAVGTVGVVLCTNEGGKQKDHSYLMSVSAAFVPVSLIFTLLLMRALFLPHRQDWFITVRDFEFKLWTFANLMGLVSGIRAGFLQGSIQNELLLVLIHLLSLLFVGCLYCYGLNTPNVG